MKKSKNWLSHKLKDDGDLVNKFTVKPAILNEVIENPYSLPTAFYETMGKAYEPPKRARIVDADTVISEGAGEILDFDEETGEVKGRREGGKETEKIGVLEKEVEEEVKEEEVKVDVVVKVRKICDVFEFGLCSMMKYLRFMRCLTTATSTCKRKRSALKRDQYALSVSPIMRLRAPQPPLIRLHRLVPSTSSL